MASSSVDHCPSQVPVSVKVSSTPRQAAIAWGWSHFLAAWSSTQKHTYAGKIRRRASAAVRRSVYAVKMEELAGRLRPLTALSQEKYSQVAESEPNGYLTSKMISRRVYVKPSLV